MVNCDQGQSECSFGYSQFNLKREIYSNPRIIALSFIELLVLKSI